MSKRYTPEFKALVLQTLDRNGGSVQNTSLVTGVPERSIRQWRQQRRLWLPENSRQRRQIELPPEIADLENASESDVFKFMRDQLMRGLLTMLTNFADDAEDATFHQRANALAKLIDRLPKVTAWRATDEPSVIRIEYVDSDGSVHLSPYWHRDDGGTDEDYDLTPWKRKPHLQTEEDDTD